MAKKQLVYEIAVCPTCLEQVFSDKDGNYPTCGECGSSDGPIWVEAPTYRWTARSYVKTALRNRDRLVEAANRAADDEAA